MNSTISKIMTNHALHVGVVGALSMLGGAAAGFAVASRKLNEQMELKIQQEVAEVKRHYTSARVANLPDKPDPEQVMAESIIKDHDYAVTDDEERPEKIIEDGAPDLGIATPVTAETPDMKRASIFSGEDADAWDWDEEHKKREASPNVFVITKDEFDENEHEHENETLTAYSDDVLADPNDMPVEDVSKVVGDDALTSFGHGSDDRNVVYVRNMEHGTDYEVVNDDRPYTEVVLGFTGDESPHLKHSGSRSHRRRQMLDE